MNDDLESQLARWRPADAPPDLLRRLRAAEPRPDQTGGIWLAVASLLRGEGDRSWPRLAAGSAAVVMVASVGWIVFSAFPATRPGPIAGRVVVSLPRAAEAERKTHETRLADESGGAPSGTRLDLRDFVRSSLRYAALDAGADASSTDRLSLDAPLGPMRLDCGYTSPGGELGGSPSSPFQLSVRDQF